MKLATLNDGTRDGRLVVVSKDITRCCAAGRIAPTLQYALDHWETVAPALEALYTDVEHWAVPCQRFHEREALAPLPRAYQWADGSVYLGHIELGRAARGEAMPESLQTEAVLFHGASDGFLPPRGDIVLADPAWGADFEGEIACITDDVPQGVTAAAAAGHIKLLLLANDVTLRALVPGELAKGYGLYQSKPGCAFSPVTVTPDELGDAWAGGLIHLPLMVELNGAVFGRADAGRDASFSLADLVAHAARTRPLGAGSLIGSGAVNNRGGEGYSCIADARAAEVTGTGEAKTPFLQPGDRVRIEMRDAAHHSIFGAMEHGVVAA